MEKEFKTHNCLECNNPISKLKTNQPFCFRCRRKFINDEIEIYIFCLYTKLNPKKICVT